MSVQAHILLVDYAPAIIDKLAFFLEHSCDEVKTATNREEALANIKIEDPKLNVSDVLMPKMDGHGLLRALGRDVNWTPQICFKRLAKISN